MSSKNYVLLVDDKIGFAEELKRSARPHNIDIVHKTNFRDMEVILPSIASKLTLIVLDIKCLKEPNQPIEGEDFLTIALSLLDEKYKELPRAILTADAEGFSTVKTWFPQEKLYKKIPGDIEALFNYITQKGLELENIKIKNKYFNVFQIFERGHVDISIENELVNLIKNMHSDDLSQIKSNLVTIRRVQESILQTINKLDKSIVPDSCFKPNNDVKFWDAHKHLGGNKHRRNNHQPTQTEYYSGVIKVFSECVYKVSSDNGAHNPYLNPAYQPTSFTVQAMVYSLFDLLLWFKTTV
ncbi:hypothetical protein [Marinicrinis sediminis]|uniref:Response regulator n=1 Tax=Marinicrinis sediminis TaxID=1652465 RepID=A0ABW5R965_9BACL